jgi:hypothetical protein
MMRTTRASIAYIATQVRYEILSSSELIIYCLYQVRFALSSSPVFSRTDIVTDSERFYNSILELLDDPLEKQEVEALLTWWNRLVSQSDPHSYYLYILADKYFQVTLRLHVQSHRAGCQQRYARSGLLVGNRYYVIIFVSRAMKVLVLPNLVLIK